MTKDGSLSVSITKGADTSFGVYSKDGSQRVTIVGVADDLEPLLIGPEGPEGPRGLQGIPGVNAKRMETYVATSNSTGDISLTFSSAFPAVPRVIHSLLNSGSPRNQCAIKTLTTTGLTAKVTALDTSHSTELNKDVITAGQVNISGEVVHFLVCEI